MSIIYVGFVRLPRIPVTTRIIISLGGDPYKQPSFATGILGGGTTQYICNIVYVISILNGDANIQEAWVPFCHRLNTRQKLSKVKIIKLSKEVM